MATIAAISTPQGVGGISVIRLSGNQAKQIACKVFLPTGGFNFEDAEPRKMYLGIFNAANFTEKCMAVYFKSPNSYTGEDIVEFQCHGGIVIANGILTTLLNNGATLAGPGEFTKRAFVNGKLSLDEAEGVMDMINAESESEVRAGYNLLNGNLSKEIIELQNDLTKMLAKIEVVLDYPENDYEDQTSEEVENVLVDVKSKIDSLIETSSTGMMIKNGSKILILGKPNVGKSSLLNSILNYERAIVTEIKGTTRDILEETYVFKGVKFVLTDTAGVHESHDEVEKIGIKKAKEAINYADVVLVVLDASTQLEPEDVEILNMVDKNRTILVLNKCDLKTNIDLSKYTFEKVIKVSALNKSGIEELKQTIYDLVIDKNIISSNILITNQRHLQALNQANKYVLDALNSLHIKNTLDIVSIDIKNVWMALGEITGNSNNESIVDEIFSSFCVGK